MQHCLEVVCLLGVLYKLQSDIMYNMTHASSDYTDQLDHACCLMSLLSLL